MPISLLLLLLRGTLADQFLDITDSFLHILAQPAMEISLECLNSSVSTISVLGHFQVVKFFENLGVVLAQIFDQSRVNFFKFGLLDNLDHQAVQKLAIAALQRCIENA